MAGSSCGAVMMLPQAENAAAAARRVCLLDVHPLCYKGDKPNPVSFVTWMRRLLSIVSNDPIVAVFDGEKGNDFRRRLLPSYKANRKKYQPRFSKYKRGDLPDLEAAFPHIHDFFQHSGIPTVKVDDAEADDVVATLAYQALNRNMKVVVASPDKDFKQLISERLQLVVPLEDLERWSFYTLKDYIFHHKCEPSIELSLRCFLGDAADGVPGLPDVATGWGRNTALKLMQRHGSLDALLKAAATRTVGKPYIQDALRDHAELLRMNLEVLSLRRDVDITLEEQWCLRRDTTKDSIALLELHEELQRLSSSQRSRLRKQWTG